MTAFNVRLNGKLIDTIFYSDSVRVDAEEVRRSLINHDGYDPGIVVNKRRKAPVRKNPTYRPGRVWTKLSPRKRQFIIDKVGSAPTAIKAFLKKVHRHGKIALLTRKNPFRKLRRGRTIPDLLQGAQDFRRAARIKSEPRDIRILHVGVARDLRRQAYYTPKRRKKA